MPLRSTQSLLVIQLPTSPEGAAQELGPMGTSANMGRTARENNSMIMLSIAAHCALAGPTLGFPLTRGCGLEPLVAEDQIAPAVRMRPGRRHLTGSQDEQAAE